VGGTVRVNPKNILFYSITQRKARRLLKDKTNNWVQNRENSEEFPKYYTQNVTIAYAVILLGTSNNSEFTES
jgi:hypothetical protein